MDPHRPTGPDNPSRATRRTEGPTAPAALVLLTCLSALTACAPDGPGSSGPAVTVRDSAGVTVVENPASAVSPFPWTLGDAPILEIGALEGPETHQLFRVADALRLPDGRLAVANAGTSEIRMFGADGAHLGTLGGEGDGPGELRFPQHLVPWAGDTLGVWDLRQRRLTLFGPEGEAGRTVSFPDVGEVRNPVYAGLVGDLGAVVIGRDFPAPEELSGSVEVIRPPTRAAVVTVDGKLRGSLGALPGSEGAIRASEGAIEIYRHPFYRQALAATWGDRVVFTTTDRWELRVHTAQGTLDRIVRVDVAPTPFSEAERAAYVEARVARAPEEARASARATLEETPFPDSLPAFDDILPDGDGNLWVQEFRLETEEGPERWLVFDAEGRLLGTVETPAGLTVHQVGADFLLGTATDELGVERVQLWELEGS